MYATEKNKLASVEMLCNNGANVYHRDKVRPYHCPISHCRVNCQLFFFPFYLQRGRMMLPMAVEGGHFEVTNLLISRGAETAALTEVFPRQQSI